MSRKWYLLIYGNDNNTSILLNKTYHIKKKKKIESFLKHLSGETSSQSSTFNEWINRKLEDVYEKRFSYVWKN